MEIFLTLSDQVWGGKQRRMLDFARGLTNMGHGVSVAAEEGGQALQAAQQVVELTAYAVPRFNDDSDAAIRAMVDVVNRVGPHVVGVSGRYDLAASVPALSGMEEQVALVFFRNSFFPISNGYHDDLPELLRRVDLCVTLSRDQIDDQFSAFVADGVMSADRFEVIPNGVSDDIADETANYTASDARRSLGLDPAEFCFTIVGRLSWEKGVDRVIRAFANLTPDHRKHCRLLIVGTGPDEAALRRQANDAGCDDRVVFLGYQPELGSVLAATDVFVAGSVLAESAPITILEAMSAGIVAVCPTAVGKGFIENGVSGFLFDDDRGLRDMLDRLAADRQIVADVRPRVSGVIRESFRLGRRIEHLSWRLDLLGIERLPLRRVLAELRWDDVRVREEREKSGGYLFVPRTSQILELDEAECSAIGYALSSQDPTVLADITATRRPARELVALLFRMGALCRPVRPGQGGSR